MMHYVERFEAAIQALIADGPVKQRLTRAYSDHLEDLQDAELPVQAKGALKDLHTALHSVPPVGKQSSVKASVQKMSSGEAGWHAETIFKLYAELLTQAARPEPLKVVERAAGGAVRTGAAAPRFLVTGN